MGNYDWSKDDIKQKIKLIESFEDKEKYLSDISTLNSMLNKTTENRNATNTIREQLESKKDGFKEWITDFIKSVEANGTQLDIPPFRFNYLSNDDCLMLVHDFYKTRHPHIYENFVKEFDKKDTNLRMKESLFYSSSVTYYINCFNQIYIDIEKSNSIFDVVNLAHEYGHAVGIRINNDIMNNDYFLIIDDIEGEYFQLEFINWLINNNIYPKDAVLSKLYINQRMYCKARYLEHMYNLQKLSYLISYLTSIELNYSDQKDELFIRLITHKPNSIDNMLSVLNDFIVLNKSASTYQKALKKEANQYFV